MKLSGKVIEEVTAEIVGEDIIPLVKELKNKKNVSEFKLAEKLKKEINVTRNLLYKLYQLNLVSFIRRKDKVKGWYIYYWKLIPQVLDEIIIKEQKDKLKELKNELKTKSSTEWMKCPLCKKIYTYETALELSFSCPECEKVLEMQKTSTKKVRDEIKVLEKDIKQKETTLKTKKQKKPEKKEKAPKKKAVKKTSKKKIKPKRK